MPTLEQPGRSFLDHVGVVGAECVEVLDAVRPDAHVRRKGEDVLSGETILEAGTILGAAEISAPVSARAVAQVSQQVSLRQGRVVE